MSDRFLKRLWPRWKMFEALDTSSREELTKIVTRQYVSHVAEFLGLDDPDNASWHPFENFVSPSLSEIPRTGDIFKLEDGLFVVLSPQCDMATETANNVILVKCVPGSDRWQQAVTALRAADTEAKRERHTKTLRDFVNQNIGQSKHFLPPLPDWTEPLLVDFSLVIAMPRVDLKLRLKDRVASISSPFLANIVQRFGAYISRTGQPNIDINRF